MDLNNPRLIDSAHNLGYECCYCWSIDAEENMHLHEIIISRGDALGMDLITATFRIMNRCNCGWVHEHCHRYAEGGQGRMKGIMYLIRYEGLSNIIRWLTSDIGDLSRNINNYIRDVNVADGLIRSALDRDDAIRRPDWKHRNI